MNETAIKYEFVHYRSCTCPGYPQRRYYKGSKNELKLYIHPTRNTWWLYENGRRTKAGNAINLEATLKQLEEE